MTDLELIQLLQQKSAGELTPAEVDAIRARWTQSPELRQALVEHLHLESQLIGALATVPLDVDIILERASRKRRDQAPSSFGWGWLIGLCLLLASGVGLSIYFTQSDKPVVVPEKTIVAEVKLPVEFPADAMLPSNMQEPSADSALDVAIGEKPAAPVEPPSVEPAKTVIPKPSPVEIAANEPWSASLARDLAPWGPASPKLTSDYKSSGHDEFSEAEAKRWFAPVDGLPFSWSNDTISSPPRRMSKFQGLAKLRAPWPDDAVLRMSPFEVTDLTLYFWRGPTGVALRFYTRREPHLWAAFEISRENSSPKPTRWGLLSTDSGTYSRSTAGMVDIRQQGGELVLARGGLVLLSVPFGGAPLEVYVEGEFRLRGVTMFRSAPFSSRPNNDHPAVASGPASKIPWAISLESPASLTEEADGSVLMTVDSREKAGTICFPFDWLQAIRNSPQASSGLFEAIVNVESADPGTGIFLGDRDGRPIQQLAFFKDATTQQTTFGILRPGEVRSEANYQPADFPPPYLAKSAWFKLTAGLGTFHVQSSGDGRHWGHVVESPGRDLPGAVGSMGLFGLPGAGPRSIRVRHIEVRELDGIMDLADPKLRYQLVSSKKGDRNELASWSHRVLESQPVDADTDAWFTTNAVATLSQGPSKEFGLSLLRHLLDAVLTSQRTLQQKQRFLDDACALCDTFDDGHAKIWGLAYEELGRQLANSDEPDPLTKFRAAWLWSPIWTASKMRFVWERLHSRQLLQAVYRRDWPAAWRLSQSAGYWNSLPHPDQRPTERGEELDRHARWAKTLVGEIAPQLDNGTAGVMPIGWRHPLVPVLNKEAYNVRAELESALSGQNYEDACRIVMSIAENDAPGLLPDPEDRQLFVSMSTAISSARRSHNGFAQTMSEKFEPLGQIRVQSAMNRRDFAALQAATLQFMGTDAARNAHITLGDLALSIGQFEVAEQHFQDALIDANHRSLEIIEPRLLLANALGGRMSASQTASIAAKLPAHPIVLNGTSISPSEFQAILSDLVSRSNNGRALVETSRKASESFPQSRYKLEPRAQFDGHPGTNPGRGEYRFGDPFGRQLAVTSDESRIYVSNRFQVNAYSVTEGKQLWAQGLGSEQGDAYALRFTPMKPLVAGQHLFVRRLTKAGTELACLKADDGQVVWHVRPSHSVVSDPVIWNGRLFAMTLAKIDDEFVQAEATWFDPATGKTSMSRPLYRFREAPDRPFSGQLAVNDRIAVCTMAGTTASFDSRGEMRWLRRSTLLQKPVDELADDARVAPPVIQSGRVITTLPGVREVTCLDLESGAINWSTPIFNMRGLIDSSDRRVVIETVSGLTALDAQTGEIAWQFPIDSRLEALNSDGTCLTVTRRSTLPGNKSRPVLMWIDLQTGHELAQTSISIVERDEIQVGSMFSAAGKWWAFVGQTWKDPRRDLHEFIPVPSALPKPYVDETLHAWRPRLLDSHLAEIQTIVPGWFPAADYHARLAVFPGDIRGETFTLLSKIDSSNLVRFTSQTHFLGNGKPTLRLRVGNQPGQKWKLTVRTVGRVLLEQVVEDAGSTNSWRDVIVDLSPVSDQNVTLHLIQTAIDGAADALWKKAEIVVE